MHNTNQNREQKIPDRARTQHTIRGHSGTDQNNTPITYHPKHDRIDSKYAERDITQHTTQNNTEQNRAGQQGIANIKVMCEFRPEHSSEERGIE